MKPFSIGALQFESFLQATFIVIAPAIVLGWFFWDRMRRQQLARQLGELPVLSRVMASASGGRRVAKMVLFACAAALLAFAAARPTIQGKRKVELHGLDLVVAVDVSKSMMVDDVGKTAAMIDKKVDPTRLARARELAVAVIDELPGDRVAPVVFAGAASHFPLTEDHEVAARFLYDLGPTDLPPGSNLAEVFRVSRCMLRPDLYEDLGCARMGHRGHGGDPLNGESLDGKSKKGAKDKDKDDDEFTQLGERGKAILIVSDGGDVDEETLKEVATARELGIAVVIAGVGTPAGGLVYDLDSLTGRRTSPKHTEAGNTVTSKRDDTGMRRLATVAGDPTRYLPTSPTGEVDPAPIVDQLHNVNRGLATKKIEEQKDIYQPFVLLAILLLVVEVAIGTRKRQRYPEGAEEPAP